MGGRLVQSVRGEGRDVSTLYGRGGGGAAASARPETPAPPQNGSNGPWAPSPGARRGPGRARRRARRRGSGTRLEHVRPREPPRAAMIEALGAPLHAGRLRAPPDRPDLPVERARAPQRAAARAGRAPRGGRGPRRAAGRGPGRWTPRRRSPAAARPSLAPPATRRARAPTIRTASAQTCRRTRPARRPCRGDAPPREPPPPPPPPRSRPGAAGGPGRYLP